MIDALNCPTCGHELQVDKGKKQKILLYCFKCADSNRAALAALARSLSPDAITLLKVQKKPRIEHTEEELANRLTFAQRNLKTDAVAQKFLADRGISAETAEAFRLGSGSYYREHRLVIPYLSGCFSESLTQLRYRRLSQSSDKNGKWGCDRVAEIHGRVLFNRTLLQNWNAEDSDLLFLVESELDCLALISLGFKAASVDTANHILIPEDIELLLQVKNLVLCFDADAAGEKCTSRFKHHLLRARQMHWREAVKDIGELRAAVGVEQFMERLHTYAARVKQS